MSGGARAARAVAAPRALVIGEALVDVIDGEALPGGSPLNVAVGLSRLGIPTELASRFGDDAHGARIAAHLAASGVVSLGQVPGATTSRAEVVLNGDGQADYRFALDTSLPRADLGGIALVHSGSLGAVLHPGAAEVSRAFAAPGRRLRSYDPNIRPGLMRDRDEILDAVEGLASRSHIVKLSDEDAEWLFPGASPEGVLDRFVELGVCVAVLTRGSQGCLARTTAHTIALPADRVEVVDTVGAGDAFTAALLAWILGGRMAEALLRGAVVEERDLVSALSFASTAAGVTSSRAGADPPWLRELAEARPRPE